MEEYVKKSEVERMIQDGINRYMTIKQFTLSKIPAHDHDGASTTKLPITSIKDTIAYDSTVSFDPAFDGFVRQALNAGQDLNSRLGVANNIPFYTLPVGVIYGYNLPGQDTFLGGEAKTGTMVFFDNRNTVTPSTSQLWIRTDSGWFGMNADKFYSII